MLEDDQFWEERATVGNFQIAATQTALKLPLFSENRKINKAHQMLT